MDWDAHKISYEEGLTYLLCYDYQKLRICRHEFTCSCRDYAGGKLCKHLLCVSMDLQRINPYEVVSGNKELNISDTDYIRGSSEEDSHSKSKKPFCYGVYGPLQRGLREGSGSLHLWL